MYAQLNFVCDTHGGPAISAGTPEMILPYNEETKTYEIDPSNMYCVDGEGDHEFVIVLSTSDGVTVRVPMPK